MFIRFKHYRRPTNGVQEFPGETRHSREFQWLLDAAIMDAWRTGQIRNYERRPGVENPTRAFQGWAFTTCELVQSVPEAIDTKVLVTGYAFTSPDDTFSRPRGRQVALGRMLVQASSKGIATCSITTR